MQLVLEQHADGQAAHAAAADRLRAQGAELVAQFRAGGAHRVVSCMRDVGRPSPSGQAAVLPDEPDPDFDLVRLDVADASTFGALRDRLAELDAAGSKVSVLFNNAGVAPGRDCALGGVDYDAWRVALDSVASRGTLAMTRREALPHSGQDAGMARSAMRRFMVNGPQPWQSYS